MIIILFLLSLILDNILPNIFNHLIPFISISLIVILSMYKYDKVYLIFIFGVIYDLFNTNLIFIHGFIFIGLYYVSLKILNNSNNYFKGLLSYFICILLYNFILFIITLGYNINYLDILKIILNSLLLNFIFYTFNYVICLINKINYKNT